MNRRYQEQLVELTLESSSHLGSLGVPREPLGIVIFAHGSGSSRLSPRNRFVAEVLRSARLATLLFDLLTEEEDRVYANRFDIDLLTRRLVAAAAWTKQNPRTRNLPVGLFGASTGAAAALKAAAVLGDQVHAIVSRGGRPDLAGDDLEQVRAPSLLIVGGDDSPVIELNEYALRRLKAPHELRIIPGATHLFEEPGTLEQVAETAARWFQNHLGEEF